MDLHGWAWGDWVGRIGVGCFSAHWIHFLGPLFIMLQILALTFLVIVEAILMES